MPVVPALGGQKQVVHELLTSLGYTVRLYLMKQESVFNCVCILPSEEESRLAARKYARVVQKLGFPVKFFNFKIQNMVGSCDVKFPIRLEVLALTHRQFSRYEGFKLDLTLAKLQQL